MFFLEGIIGGIRIGIAPLPELLDKLFALFVGLQLYEGAPLLVSNNVDYVFVQPLLVGTRKLVVKLAIAGRLFLLFVVLLLIAVLLGTLPRRRRRCWSLRVQR